MFFINDFEEERVTSELKYCERCGGLWIRPQGVNEVYCSACQAHLALLPRLGRRRATRREHEVEEMERQLVIRSVEDVTEEVQS